MTVAYCSIVGSSCPEATELATRPVIPALLIDAFSTLLKRKLMRVSAAPLVSPINSVVTGVPGVPVALVLNAATAPLTVRLSRAQLVTLAAFCTCMDAAVLAPVGVIATTALVFVRTGVM